MNNATTYYYLYNTSDEILAIWPESQKSIAIKARESAFYTTKLYKGPWRWGYLPYSWDKKLEVIK